MGGSRESSPRRLYALRAAVQGGDVERGPPLVLAAQARAVTLARRVWASRLRLRPRSLFAEAVELAGLCAIVYGVETVNRTAGFIVGGLLAVLKAAEFGRKTP